MKEFLESLKSNLSNVFSIVGILLTIYFSIFYVPQYVNEIERKKLESTHEALIEIIQELVYNNHEIDSNDLKTLIRSNELSKDIVYPYTIDELLIQVQGSFINNKFIPLKQRKSLVEKLDLIRESIPEEAVVEKKNKNTAWLNLLSYIVSFMGVIVAGLGLSGVWKRSIEIKEMELQSSIEETKEAIKSQVKEGIALEKVVFEAIKDIPDIRIVTVSGPNNPVDFLIKTECGTRIGIEAKYTETDVIPVRSIDQMISASNKLKAPLVLVANASLSRNAAKKLENYNKSNPDLIIEFVNTFEVDDLVKFIKECVYKYT